MYVTLQNAYKQIGMQFPHKNSYKQIGMQFPHNLLKIMSEILGIMKSVSIVCFFIIKVELNSYNQIGMQFSHKNSYKQIGMQFPHNLLKIMSEILGIMKSVSIVCFFIIKVELNSYKQI